MSESNRSITGHTGNFLQEPTRDRVSMVVRGTQYINVVGRIIESDDSKYMQNNTGDKYYGRGPENPGPPYARLLPILPETGDSGVALKLIEDRDSKVVA
jgi:hypothetical protein